MKRSYVWMITALVVINIVCLVMIIFHGGDQTLNGVFATPSVKNLGKVKDKKELTGDFYISNISHQEVNILDAKVSCGCLKLNVPKRQLKPGEKMKVTLQVNPKGYFGKQSFDAVLTTDHPFTPTVRILLTCHVSATVPHESIPTNIGEFTPSAQIDETIDVSYPADVITLAGINSDDADITATLEERGEPSDSDEEEQEGQTNPWGKYKLHITGKAPARAGQFRMTIDLEAQGADWKQAKETIIGTVVSAFQPVDTVAFGFINPGEEKTEEIKIKARLPKTLQSAEAVSQRDILRKEVAIEDNTPVLRLTIKNTGPSGSFDDTVGVTIEDAEGVTYQVTVPVRAYFY